MRSEMILASVALSILAAFAGGLRICLQLVQLERVDSV